MTEIVLDTETTGLKPEEGDRIVEIGMVEVSNFARTGRRFHKYVNPIRPMSDEALAVHGLSDTFLADKPSFEQIADELLEFIGDTGLVVHNAEFDLAFINMELEFIGKAPIDRNRVFDTLEHARRELPQLSRHSLDALCQHFKIDNSNRQIHGALVDAELLADVYFALLGKGHDLLDLLDAGAGQAVSRPGQQAWRAQSRPVELPPRITGEEAAAHAALVETLGNDAVWNKYAS